MLPATCCTPVCKEGWGFYNMPHTMETRLTNKAFFVLLVLSAPVNLWLKLECGMRKLRAQLVENGPTRGP